MSHWDAEAVTMERAREARDRMTHIVLSYDQLKAQMEGDGGVAVCGWCGDGACEARVKEETKATIRLIPFQGGEGAGPCVVCGKEAKRTAYFARAY